MQFVRFCLVGGLGFMLDAGVLMGLVSMGWHPLLARLLSFLVAATGTWLLNRSFTFSNAPRDGAGRQWFHYLTVNGLGGGINYLCYALAYWLVDEVRQQPVIGVAIGSAVALLFNYFANKHLVFRTLPKVVSS